MKASTSFWHQLGLLSLVGTTTSRTGWNAQWPRALSESPVSFAPPAPTGAGAPILTHCSSKLICVVESLVPALRGGMEISGSD